MLNLLDGLLVIMDNVSLKFFYTQSSLSTRQAQWMDFLASFDFEIQYQPRKGNVVADALSRQLSFTAISFVQSTLLVQLAGQCVNDPSFEDVILKLKDTTIVKDKFPYELQGEVLLYKERLCLPSHGSCRIDMLQDHHSSSLAGHFGVAKSYEFLKKVIIGQACLKMSKNMFALV
jgi:hypothetical protein